MELADAMVCLHDLVKEITPISLQSKLHVIFQSAKPLTGPRKFSGRNFNICVVSHLREIKDPMRTALAVRTVPNQSKIKVTHLGMAHDGRSAARAIREMKQNPRYVWKGEVAGWQVRQELKRSHLMVISSRAEGGANVISEAVVAGVPVIASKIDGNVGLLGKNYRGYYPVGNTKELRKVILKAEKDKVFFQSLTKQCNSIKSKFTAEREQESWAKLINNIT